MKFVDPCYHYDSVICSICTFYTCLVCTKPTQVGETSHFIVDGFGYINIVSILFRLSICMNCKHSGNNIDR